MSAKDRNFSRKALARIAGIVQRELNVYADTYLDETIELKDRNTRKVLGRWPLTEFAEPAVNKHGFVMRPREEWPL